MYDKGEIVYSGEAKIPYSIIRYKSDDLGTEYVYDVLSETMESHEWFETRDDAIRWAENGGY